MKLLEAHQLASDLMQKHGLPQQGWTLSFGRAHRMFGWCNYFRRHITISAPLTELNEMSDVQDVILHEIAHALAPMNAHHGPVWQKIAQGIGCNGKRCYGSHVKRPPLKYKGVCPNGHVTYSRARRRSSSCGRCDSQYNPNFVYTWSLNK